MVWREVRMVEERSLSKWSKVKLTVASSEAVALGEQYTLLDH
jgi:hypothetical protein